LKAIVGILLRRLKKSLRVAMHTNGITKPKDKLLVIKVIVEYIIEPYKVLLTVFTTFSTSYQNSYNDIIFSQNVCIYGLCVDGW